MKLGDLLPVVSKYQMFAIQYDEVQIKYYLSVEDIPKELHHRKIYMLWVSSLYLRILLED